MSFLHRMVRMENAETCEWRHLSSKSRTIVLMTSRESQPAAPADVNEKSVNWRRPRTNASCREPRMLPTR